MVLFFLLLASVFGGTVFVLTSVFPRLSISSIFTYFVYQNENFLEFGGEKHILFNILTVSYVFFYICHYIIPSFFPAEKKKRVRIISIFTVFALSIGLFEIKTHFVSAVRAAMTEGNLYEKTFKAPSYTPPQTYRNLIFLYLESVEDTFQSEEVFGKNLIPYLSSIKTFSGYTEIQGSNDTYSSMISSFCGLPNVLPFLRNDVTFYFPRNVCLTDILAGNGYKTLFFTSDNKSFASKDVFWEKHHVQTVEDGASMAETKEDLGFHWYGGVKDSITFKKALETIKLIGEVNEPFAIFISTLNTHDPTGFLEPDCDSNSDDEFKDIISCTDKQVRDFITELEKTPFFKDTLIVVAGDHLARKNTLYSLLEKQKDRFIFNAFINTDRPFPSLNRTFTALDLGATVLELLGFELKDGALGLGRSLLRSDPTLIEEYGKENLEGELLKKSEKYNDFLKK